MLKKVLPEEGPHELRISQMFSSREVSMNTRNHCVQLLDVIKLPNSNQQLMVMPFLRPFDEPRFQTLGEFVGFFTQICEVRLRSSGISHDWPYIVVNQGIQFMHERNIAHRYASTRASPNQFPIRFSGIVRQTTLCSTRLGCTQMVTIRFRSIEGWTF